VALALGGARHTEDARSVPTRNGKAHLLNKIPLFSECSRAELARRGGDRRASVPAGRVLMRQGTVDRELLVLVDGEVTVARDGETIAVRGSGDFIGELALVTHRPRSATVTAATDVRRPCSHWPGLRPPGS
jgi:CRP/FNR family cyclic AMP-dependent transcriptional regulator